MQIRFRYKGVEYTGDLSKVSGAASSGTYHLMVKENDGVYYWGELSYSNFLKKWVFYPSKGVEGMEVLAEWMGGKVQNQNQL